MELDTARKRLNRAVVIGSLLFSVVCCAAMLLFKWNETYFDTYSSTLWRGQTIASAEQSEATRYNMNMQLTDRADGQFVLPLVQSLPQDNILVREEFTQHKLVVTLVGATPCVESGSEVTTDATLMDAVGVYRQQENVVVEIYAKDAYAYELTCTDEALTITFSPLDERYDRIAVVYLPQTDRERLSQQDDQALEQLAQTYSMKIYTAYTMQEDYSQADIVNFANEVRADLLIGLEVEESQEAQLTTWCNPEYFIPDFGSVELAAVVTDALLDHCGADGVSVTAADANCPLVSLATMPSVLAHLATPLTKQSIDYDLDKQLMSALAAMLEQALAELT